MAQPPPTLVYNSKLDLAYCEQCEAFLRLDGDSVRKHVRNVHKCSGSQPRESESALMDARKRNLPLSDATKVFRSRYMKYYNQSDNTTQDCFVGWDEYLPRIAGLPVFKAFMCNKCYYLTRNETKLRSHVESCKQGFSTVSAQTLFSGNATRYFPVQSDIAPCSWLEARISETDVSVCTQPNSVPDSERGAFLSVLRVQEHLSAHSLTPEIAADLCNWTGDSSTSRRLFRYMRDYLFNARDLYDRNVYIKTQWVAGSQIYLSVSDDTIDRYVRRLLPLIYFLSNFTKRTIQMATSDDLSQGTDASAADIEVLLNVATQLCNPDIAFDTGKNLLHNILMRTFINISSCTMNLIPIFISCSCVSMEDYPGQTNTRFKDGSEVSPMLAAMMYLVQCVAVLEVHGDMCTHANLSQTVSSIDERWKALSTDLSRHETPVNYIRYCLDVCNNIRDNEISHVRFIICQKHCRCGILDGVELSLSSLSSAISEKTTAMKNMLGEELLFGFGKNLGDSFTTAQTNWKDNFNERRGGYWFGLHPSNVADINGFRSLFSAHLLQIDFARNDNSFDKDRSKTFIQSVHKFMVDMFWLITVVSGGPARATELASVLFRNSAHAARHIFLHNGRLMTVIFYHKSRGKLRGVSKPIARFLDKATSELLLTFLVFVKPLEEVVTATMGYNQSRSVDVCSNDDLDKGRERNYLFSIRGSKISERVLCSGFQANMKLSGADMTMRQYRQFHGGAVKHFLPKEIDVNTNPMQPFETMQIQSGHTASTANMIYGVSEVNMRKLDTASLEAYRRSSELWHNEIGIGNEVKTQHFTNGNDQDNTLPTNNNQSQHTSVSMASEQRLRRLEYKLDSLLSILQGESTDTQTAQPSLKRQRMDSNHRSERHLGNEESILGVLRTLLRNQSATFRTNEQRLSLLHICQTQTDALFVQPTGTGKSMLFMVPAMLCAEKVVVLIVPLVSLQKDFKRRCNDVGIPIADWEERYVAGKKIILCGCEAVEKEDYRSFIQETYNTGRLLAIFIDEVHLLAQWSSFRPVLARMNPHIKASCNVPVYAMTATCPPILQSDICSLASLSIPTIVRQSGSRKNISYRVIKVDEDLDSIDMFIIDIIRADVRMFKKQSKEKVTMQYIVYCNTRLDCDDYKESIAAVGRNFYEVFKYHAGMSREDRVNQAERWATTKTSCYANIMIATSAFGCGIDMPNVRIVIHAGFPRSTMAFLQESGRAGRSGMSAKSIILVPGSQYSNNQQIQTAPNSDTSNVDWSDTVDAASDDWCIERWNALDNDKHKYGDMSSWLQHDTDGCRRWLLDKYCDDEQSMLKCADRGFEKCDICLAAQQTHETDDFTKPTQHLVHTQPYTPDYVQPTLNYFRGQSSTQNQIATHSNTGATGDMAAETHGTPKVTRRLSFSPTIKSIPSQSETDALSFSQSRQVTPQKFVETSHVLNGLCAVCSVKHGKRITHTRNEPDKQHQACYSGHCFKCASRKHPRNECFTDMFKMQKGWCYQCSLSSHAKSRIHREGTFGNRYCENRNAIRFIVAVYETPELRQRLEQRFPTVSQLNTLQELIAWLRTTDEDGHTWFADVANFISSELVI